MVYFSIQYIHIKIIFKRVSHFLLLLSSFWEISNYLSSRVIIPDYILKECLISKDLQIIRKKPDTVLISVYLSFTAENVKVILHCIRDLELANYTTLQAFEKARHKFYKPSCFKFSSGIWCDVLLFDCSCA